MRKSIKKMVGIRVAAALLSVLLFSVMITVNIIRVDRTQEREQAASALLDRAQKAETAHYKWSSNLSNALYAGTEFTGSIDPTTCVLGQWLYGEAGTEDSQVLSLRSQIEPLHKELHESATYVLNLLETSPGQAQEYYQQTIQTNLGTLVGMLDQVVERGTALNEESQKSMNSTVAVMHITSIAGLALALICLISLVLYVVRQIVRPILYITEKSEPLQEGWLELDLDYNENNEMGDLANTLEKSLKRIRKGIALLNK